MQWWETSLLGSLDGLIFKLTKDRLIEDTQILYVEEPHKNMRLPGSQVIEA